MVKRVFFYIVILFSLYVIATVFGAIWHYKKNFNAIKSIVSSYQYNFIIEENAYDKLCLIKHTLNKYYKLLTKSEIEKKKELLKNDLEKLAYILNTLKKLQFTNYKAFLFKYIFGIYNNEDIDISQNGKIIISKKFQNIGKPYTPPCNPFTDLGQCLIEKNDRVYAVQFSPAFDLIIESDFKIKDINKKEIKNNILAVLKSIPGLIVYADGKRVLGYFNTDKFYIFDQFKPLNIFFGIGIKYSNIDKLSNVINKEIFSSIKPFITSFLIAYALLVTLLYVGLFIIFKYKIIFIEKVLQDYNQKAHFDKLTNLYNRHGFETVFDKAKCRYFLIIDLDNFKYINDTFGHKTGDKVLRYFSTLLKHYFNDSVIARWGGDEFLVCTNKTKNDIIKSIKAISIHLQSYQKTFDHQLTKKLSVSAGGCNNRYQDFQKKFNNADLALYKVKKTGKDHIMFFEDLDYVKIEKKVN